MTGARARAIFEATPRAMLGTILESLVAFVATNVDDLFVLLLLFAAATPRARVVLGQYAGLAALVAVSLVVSLGAIAMPTGWARWLGVLPIAIGLRALWRRRRAGEEDHAPLAPSVLAVASITFANGGDNVAVYVPLFARRTGEQRIAVLAVFAAMVAVWCAAALALLRLPMVARVCARWGRAAAPWLLVLLGAAILAQS